MDTTDCPICWRAGCASEQCAALLRVVGDDWFAVRHTGGGCFAAEYDTADGRVCVVTFGLCAEGYEVGVYADDGDFPLAWAEGLPTAQAVRWFVGSMGGVL